MKGPIVSEIDIKTIKPRVLDKAFEHLLPTRLFIESASFKLSNVNNAISNAIRRTITDELNVKYMQLNVSDITITDPYVKPTIIFKRIKMIPILQEIPNNVTLSLNVTNDSPQVMDILSKSLIASDGKKYCNETFVICRIDSGCRIEFKNITIETAFGYEHGSGMCVLATNVRSIPLEKPINMYDKSAGGKSCSVSNPREFNIIFNTNGTMPAKKIVKLACESIINRVSKVVELAKTDMLQAGDEYTLRIAGETDTIGNIFMTLINEMIPNIDFVCYSNEAFERATVLKFKYEGEIMDAIDSVNNYCKNAYGQISSAFS